VVNEIAPNPGFITHISIVDAAPSAVITSELLVLMGFLR
jgi:hypothetical protein